MSEIRVSAWLDSGEAPLSPTSCCVLTGQGAERGSKLACETYKCTNPTHEGSILTPSSNPNYLPKASPPIPSYGGIGFQHMIWGGGGHKHSVHRQRVLCWMTIPAQFQNMVYSPLPITMLHWDVS